VGFYPLNPTEFLDMHPELWVSKHWQLPILHGCT